jgi:hypothetical protein
MKHNANRSMSHSLTLQSPVVTICTTCFNTLKLSSIAEPVILIFIYNLGGGFPPRRPGFAPGSGKWDVWWTKRRQGRFSPSTSVSPAKTVHSTNFSIIIIIIIITIKKYERKIEVPPFGETEWTPFQTHYISENLVAPGIETRISGSVARDSDH